MDTLFRIIKHKKYHNHTTAHVYEDDEEMIMTWVIRNVQARFERLVISSPICTEGWLLPWDERWSRCRSTALHVGIREGKQLDTYCTVHFSLVSYKVLKLIVKNQHLFVKLKSSCSVVVCLLKGTLFLHLLWLLWLFHFLFLNLIFVEKKKAKINSSIFIQHNFFHQRLMNCFPCCFR